MRETTIRVYKYSELADAAKEKASAFINDEFFWAGEAMASIKALAEKLGGEVTHWDVDWGGGTPSSMTFDMPEDEFTMKELTDLGDFDPDTLKGNGECKLTGYVMDECAIDGLRQAFLKGQIRDRTTLMDCAFQTWITAAQSDYTHQCSDEGTSDHCDANEYEFTGDGELWSGE